MNPDLNQIDIIDQEMSRQLSLFVVSVCCLCVVSVSPLCVSVCVSLCVVSVCRLYVSPVYYLCVVSVSFLCVVRYCEDKILVQTLTTRWQQLGCFFLVIRKL